MDFIHAPTLTYPITRDELRLREPNTSFPANFTAEDVAPFGYFEVQNRRPYYDPATQALVQGTCIEESGTWFCDWTIRQLTDAEIEAARKAEADALLAAAKASRAAEVEALKVTTTAGNTFDGDEVSQGRMARAIIALSAAGGTVNWVLADNSIVPCSVAELTEALAMAGAAQAAIWIKPYETANS